MIKLKLVLSAIVFSTVITTHAQDVRMCGFVGYQTVEEVNSACDYQNAEAGGDSTAATETVDEILAKTGLIRNFKVEQCNDINNALAVTIPTDGGMDRYILFDSAFFNTVSSSTGTDWGSTSILAHEIGHHLNGHTLNGTGSNHDIELEADVFSGFVLARMGCSLEDAQAAISKILPDEASSTHPAKQDRLDAIEKGWNNGKTKIIEVPMPEDVAEDEITARMVMAKYIDAIGGQEVIGNVKSLRNKVESSIAKYGSSTVMKQSYASPHLWRQDMDIFVKGKKTATTGGLYKNGYGYSLKLDGSGWGEGTRLADFFINDISFFPEYSALISNKGVTYEGVEEIGGTPYYKVKFDPTITVINVSNAQTISNVTPYKYYNMETGLLEQTEQLVKIVTITGKKKKESITESAQLMTHSDYTEVDGVLFPFKVTLTLPQFESITIIKEQEVNPEIDMSIFDL